MPQPPLMGFAWNQADTCPDRGLLMIVAFDAHGNPRPIGTGFIVNRYDRMAECVTAAHVFSEIRRYQSPPPIHAPSTPSEFLPPPRAIKIDFDAVWAVSVENGRVEICRIAWMVLDDQSDVALFSVHLQESVSDSFFSHVFEPNGIMPSVGDLVCVMSYAGMALDDQFYVDADNFGFQVRRKPVLRVGTVLNFYPDGTRLCRGPCYETSIPVYSGMSGGPAFLYGDNGPMTPFGIVSSDPDFDDEKKEDRSFEGRSIIAALPCVQLADQTGHQRLGLKLLVREHAGSFD